MAQRLDNAGQYGGSPALGSTAPSLGVGHAALVADSSAGRLDNNLDR